MMRMVRRIQMRALLMAIGMILGGGALAFAGAAIQGTESSEHGKTVSETAKQDPTAVPGVASTTGQDHQTSRADEAESEEAEVAAEGEGEGGERKKNHGFYVSSAAHCEDVEDTENDVSFTAPEDCETDGSAHGEYVSTVAKSDAGKKPHDGESEE